MSQNRSREGMFHDAHRKTLSLLASHRDEEARVTMVGYLPCMGPFDLDFALHSLEEASLIPSILSDGGASSDLAPVLDLYRLVRNADGNQFHRFLEWYHQQSAKIGYQLHNANLLRDLGMADPISLRVPSSGPSANYCPILLAEEYKNRYEVVFPLEALANLLRILKGLGFSPQPFAGLKQNGHRVTDGRGNITKGLAINWLAQESPDPRLTDLIRKAYNSTIRNVIGGHNDYRYHEISQQYECLSDGRKYSLKDLAHTNKSLERFQQIIIIQSGLYIYRDQIPIPGLDIAVMGNMNARWSIDKGIVQELIIFKYWANYREYAEWPDLVTFMPSEVHSEQCSISLRFGDTWAFPYDLRIFANQETLTMLKALCHLDEVTIRVVAVCPPFHGLTMYEIGRTTIEGKDVSVLDETRLKAHVGKEEVARTIGFLERCLDVS